MNIQDIVVNHYGVPIEGPSVDATHGKMDTVELIVVEMTTDNGLKGLGYAYTIGVGGSAIKRLIEKSLKPILIGENADFKHKLWEKMWWHLHWVGRGGIASFAISAIDIALWDLHAKSLGVPLYKLIGAHKQRIPAYGSGVDLELTPEELGVKVLDYINMGLNAIKIKVGSQDIKKDLDRIEKVRSVIGDRDLMLDVNMQWSKDEIIRYGRYLKQYDPLWLEEPCIPEDYDGFYFANQLGIPIAAGESLHSKFQFQQYITKRLIQFVQIDVITLGGITEWLKVAAYAEMNNVKVTTHYAQEIQVHLLATIPNSSYIERHSYNLDKYIEQPLKLVDGCFEVPDRPGHGMSFNKERLAQFIID